MSSDKIAKALEVIKNTSGSIAKKKLLEQLRDSDPLATARIMKAVFDIDVTYGFSKNIPDPIPPKKPMRSRQFHTGTWELLDKLAKRQLTGAAAIMSVGYHLGTLSKPSQDLLVAILQQNLRAGFGIAVVVGVWGPIVPVFDICLSQEWREEMQEKPRPRIAANEQEYDPKYHSGFFPVWADYKYDGYRAFHFEGDEGVVSRARLPVTVPKGLMTMLKEFVAEVRDHYNMDDSEQLFIDCEAVSADGIFRDVMSSSRSKKKGAPEGSQVFKIIDIITVTEVYAGRSYLPQRQRREINEALFKEPRFAKYQPHIMLTEGKMCNNAEEVEEFVIWAWELELEGLLVKTLQGYWEAKRSYSWLKYKRKGSAKGRIKGFTMGDPRGKYAGLVVSITMEEDSGVRSDVAGLTEETMAYLTEHQAELLDTQMEAMFHERTPDGVMRHPRIKDLRTDRE